MQTHSRLGFYAAVVGVLVLGIAIIFGCLVSADLLFGTGFLLKNIAARPDEYLALAESRIEIGTERDQAIQALSDAWYHGTCDYGDVKQDVFLYGSKDHRATAIVLHSVNENGKFLVDAIGTADESTWRFFKECLPPGFVED